MSPLPGMRTQTSYLIVNEMPVSYQCAFTPRSYRRGPTCFGALTAFCSGEFPPPFTYVGTSLWVERLNGPMSKWVLSGMAGGIGTRTRGGGKAPLFGSCECILKSKSGPRSRPVRVRTSSYERRTDRNTYVYLYRYSPFSPLHV